MNSEADQAKTDFVCDICRRATERVGKFVVTLSGQTDFIASGQDDHDGQYLVTHLGLLCGKCHPQQYRWLSRAVRNAKAVCADMVARHYIDQMVADRYLSGQPSHRRLDVTVQMTAYEKRLYNIGAMHIMRDGIEALNRADMDANARQRAKDSLLVLFDQADVKAQQAELERKLEDEDRYRAHADAMLRRRQNAAPSLVALRGPQGDKTC